MRVLLLALCFVFSQQLAALAVPGTGFIKKSENSRIIIFVHGYRSNGVDAWFNKPANVFWPDLIADDERFDGYDIYVHDYFTRFSGRQGSPIAISDELETVLKDEQILEYSELVFVGHSMGGIVIRDMLNDNDNLASKTSLIVLYASPLEGSKLANLASYLSENPQAIALRSSDTNFYLQQETDQWRQKNRDIPLYCGYELEETLGQIVVDRNSATDGCNASVVAIQSNHSGVVKPTSREDTTYRFLRVALSEVGADQKDVSGIKDVSISYAVNGILWGEGTERVEYTDSFVVSAPRDASTCSRRIVRRPHRVCPTFEGFPMQITDFALGSPQGNDGYAEAEITDGGRCITAYVTSIDAGRGIVGDCRGRSWLNRQEIKFTGIARVQGSTLPHQNIDLTIGPLSEEVFSTSQMYFGNSSDFEDIIWKYNLNVSRFSSDQLDGTFSLSHRNPKHSLLTTSIDEGTLTIFGQ